MGIFDRFKSKRERDLKDGGSAATASKKEEPKKEAGKGGKAGKAGKEKVTKTEAKAKKVVSLPEELQGIVIKPLVTEKGAALAGAGQYVFQVANSATRAQVRGAVNAMYGIKPERVNILNIRGKAVRFRGRPGMRSAWKKAIVTLPEGKKIDVHEGV
jgi:large subunit ribosomal protein L23